MFASLETAGTQHKVLTEHAFVGILVVAYLLQLASLAIVVKLHAHLLADVLLLLLHLLLDQTHHELLVLLVSAQGAVDGQFTLRPVLCPLLKTLQMEPILAAGHALRDQIPSHHLLVADGAQIVLVLVRLLHNQLVLLVIGWPHELQELGDLVLLDPVVRHHVSQFLVKIGGLPHKRVAGRDVEDLGEHEERVGAVVVALRAAGAFELVADGDLVLPVVQILEDEASVACDAGQVQSRKVFEELKELRRRRFSVWLKSFAHYYLL